MSYLALKTVHMSLAALSGSLFLLRGLWMLSGSAMGQRRWVRSVPHLVDSLLLATAIGLAWWSQQSPLAQPWLAAKLCALFAYIVLGAIALRHGKTRRVRSAAFVAALACLAYIVGTAVTKNPWFFL